jgi:energy-coupling factor transporter ATP-binding protein EcfA2
MLGIDFGKYSPDTFDKFLGNYKQLSALKSVLDKETKGIVVIVGASGNGKTTLGNLVLNKKRSKSIITFPRSFEDEREHEDNFWNVDTLQVVTAIDESMIPDEVLSRALITVHLEKPPVSILSEYLDTILHEEGISCTKHGLSLIIQCSKTVSNLFNNVNTVIDVTGEVTEESVQKVLYIPTLTEELEFFTSLFDDDFVHYLRVVSSRFNRPSSVSRIRKLLSQGILLVNGVTDIDLPLDERDEILKIFHKFTEKQLVWVLQQLDTIHTATGLIELIYRHAALSNPDTQDSTDDILDYMKIDDEDITKDSESIENEESHDRGTKVLEDASKIVNVNNLF